MSKKAKQIGYLSALIIVIGSTIGAGIFFKNRHVARYADGNVGFIAAAWIISAIGIILVGLALIEVASGTKSDKGFLAWIKSFNNRWFSKYTSSYMMLISLPIQFLTLPLYVVQTLQDAGGFQLNGWWVAFIAVAIFIWLSFMNFYSLKTGEYLAWFFTFLKYIPLLLTPILAMALRNNLGDVAPLSNRGSYAAGSLANLTPWLGLFLAAPIILFAFDGFYTATSLRSDLKNKNSLGVLMVVGIAIVTATYLFLSLGFGIGSSNGSISGVQLGSDLTWLKITLNVLVSMSILGLINNQVMSLPRIYKVSYEEHEFYLLKLFHDRFKFKSHVNSSFAFFVTIVLAYYVVLVPVGLYALTAQDGSEADYGQTAANLYQVADLITSFSSLVIFLWIATAMAGAVRNRSTQRVAVVKSKVFLITVFPAMIFLYGSFGLFTFETIYNVFAIEVLTQKINAVIKLVFFIWTLWFPYVIASFENNSIGYQEWKSDVTRELIQQVTLSTIPAQ